jgi:hypothetical protein
MTVPLTCVGYIKIIVGINQRPVYPLDVLTGQRTAPAMLRLRLHQLHLAVNR